jgi:hypothetical protein
MEGKSSPTRSGNKSTLFSTHPVLILSFSSYAIIKPIIEVESIRNRFKLPTFPSAKCTPIYNSVWNILNIGAGIVPGYS